MRFQVESLSKRARTDDAVKVLRDESQAVATAGAQEERGEAPRPVPKSKAAAKGKANPKAKALPKTATMAKLLKSSHAKLTSQVAGKLLSNCVGMNVDVDVCTCLHLRAQACL